MRTTSLTTDLHLMLGDPFPVQIEGRRHPDPDCSQVYFISLRGDLDHGNRLVLTVSGTPQQLADLLGRMTAALLGVTDPP